jgi:2-polyprenyl-3-methyl-5-hydroxy-6-metoxy-1,4-benzoquinol methylase
MHDRYLDANRRLWDRWTEINFASEMYDVEGFRAGRDTLNPLDAEGLGDVAGKTVLHLQCHFGQDTLSVARRGAIVTGLDFSPKAVALARSLGEETGIPGRFVEANVYDAVEALGGETFDIVFTSAGVLSWLPDLPAWGRVVGSLVKPGGFFFLRDFHPLEYLWDDDPGVQELRVKYPYFTQETPLEFPNQPCYSDWDEPVTETEYAWVYSLADIVNAVVGGGLSLEGIREYDYCSYGSHPLLQRCEDGLCACPSVSPRCRGCSRCGRAGQKHHPDLYRRRRVCRQGQRAGSRAGCHFLTAIVCLRWNPAPAQA